MDDCGEHSKTALFMCVRGGTKEGKLATGDSYSGKAYRS